ncbi:MAG: hypothetical protein A2946_00450 [Candidatus Liptonbacteria bacterium RIFCSPLOWO2_01_FULL_53_13]|uniref:Uncharacterized protein n=1 Tax=Candidatus Liptonbacteria bacterium RIFCSPLOWO2_01_FULL_53_13 TaxID=1798651 RepID=A0A1G2CJ83_9BACT|nr:MAG: hypothetical protein A2946_00450 [Candidatus Liptonbacteria bacterium RIFCSPLOWO2_01_FULL_53_13]
MDEQILARIAELEKKIDAIYRSVEKTRKYFKWTLIVTVLAIVLPLIGLAFVIPYYLKTLTSSLGGFGDLGGFGF